MPGTRSGRAMPAGDLRVHDFVGKEGEKMLPGYRYVWVPTVFGDSYGSSADHTYGRTGAFSEGIELNSPVQDFNGDKRVSEEEMLKFNDELTQGRMFVPWKKFMHPQLGEVEIGGWRHDTVRAPEGFLGVEEMHRNAMYVLFHGYHLPKLRFGAARVTKVRSGLYRIEAPVTNERMIPTMAGIVLRNRLHRVDVATLSRGKVLSSGIVQDEFTNRVRLQEHRPERLMVSDGIGGAATETLMFLVEAGPGAITLRYDSVKAGVAESVIQLP
jgi:hypothetical protein